MFHEDPRFYERYCNTTPPPTHPRPPLPESMRNSLAEKASNGERTAPPGYLWVLVKIDDINPR